jgi:hypothetical protein
MTAVVPAAGAHNMTGISLANMTHLSAADATAAGPAIEEHIAADGGQSSDGMSRLVGVRPPLMDSRFQSAVPKPKVL